MISYRDKTFCTAKCSAECPIKLTEKIKKEAEKFGLPIAMCDFSIDSDYNIACKDFEEIEK